MAGNENVRCISKRWAEWFNPRTIRTRILIGFVLITFITAVAISTGSSLVGYYNERQQALDRLESAASFKEFELKAWTEKLQNELLIAINDSSQPEQTSIILDLARSHQYYVWYIEAVRQRMEVLANQSGEFSEFCLLDLNGQIVFCTKPNWSGSDCKNEDLFRKGILGGYTGLPFTLQYQSKTQAGSELPASACWLKPFSSQDTSIMAARPVIGYGNQVLGVIAGRANSTDLYKILVDPIGLGTTGVSYLVNPDGYYLSARRGNIFNELEITPRSQYVSIFPGIAQSMSLRTNSKGVYRNYQSKQVAGVYHWLPNLGIVLAAEQDLAEVSESIRVSLFVSLGIALGAVLIALTISLLIIRSITRPLVGLVETASDIAAGNLDRDAPILADDEIGSLARAFNTMTTQLRDLIGHLEQRVGERTHALQIANEDLSRRARQLEASSEVGRKITSILDIDDLLAEVVTLIRDKFNYFHVRVYLLEGDELVLKSSTPVEYPQVERVSIQVTSLSSEAIKSNQAIVANDISHEPRYMKEPITPIIHSELVVPLRVADQTIGILDVVSVELNTFTAEDVLVIQNLGDQIAIAIDNAYLYKRSRELAVHEERARLARDLHDSVLQSLYSLNLLAEGWRRIVHAGEMIQVESYFDRAGEIARQALKEMRLMVYELRPTTLEWDGLASVLKRRLDTVESRAGVQCQLLVKGVVELPKSIEYALYQIAQEALNNALKYSKAEEVIVRLEIDGYKVLLEVADNGVGFDPASLPCQGGMGLSNMCHRAEEIGGSFVIDSAPGKGTRITVNVGLTPKESIFSREMSDEELEGTAG